MVVQVKKRLHQNHAYNSREVNGKVLILQGDYGIGDPQLEQIESLIRKIDREGSIQGTKKDIFLFSSLGTIEYALEMSGYSKVEIFEFFKDRLDPPQCFVGSDTLYIACYDLDMDKLEKEIKKVL